MHVQTCLQKLTPTHACDINNCLCAGFIANPDCLHGSHSMVLVYGALGGSCLVCDFSELLCTRKLLSGKLSMPCRSGIWRLHTVCVSNEKLVSGDVGMPCSTSYDMYDHEPVYRVMLQL